MSILMPDSIRVADLPPGYMAYLGYVDGDWPTYPALKARFPGRNLVGLTVTGNTTACNGADCENGDLTVNGAIAWALRKLESAPDSRPVLYASAFTMAMPAGLLNGLKDAGIPRPTVRLLSAHYGQGEHICGPDSCRLVPVEMDGTQWTDTFDYNHADIDMSLLADGFFGTPSETEVLVEELGIVAEGDPSMKAVSTVQGLCCARGQMVTIDGVFGPVTKGAVQRIQAETGINDDGVVGPETWPVLLGVAG